MSDLSRVLDALPGLVWSALPDGHIDFLNRRFCEYTGLAPDEAFGQGWHCAIHPEDLPDLLERWGSTLAAGEPTELEARLRRFDGEYRWFLISSNPMCDEEGQVVRWYGVNTDIEDHRRAEEALRLRELNFRLIVDSIPVPVAVTTPTGEVEGVNRPTLEYFGKTFEELKSWATSDAVHPDDLQDTASAAREAHETGRAYNVESRHRRSDGVYRWFNVRGFPLRDAEGGILRWFILQIDIDDRKRAEEALQASEDNLNQIINTMPALAWSARPDGSAEFFNQHYLDYMGLSAEQAREWGWTAAVHPDDLDELIAAWQRMVASDGPGECEGRLRRFDGAYRWFLLRANPLRDESGKTVKWYGINTDIEERKQAESLLAGEKRLLEMVAGGHSLSGVLEALCRLVESTASGCYCSVVLVDPSGTRLEYGAAPSLPGTFIGAIIGRAVSVDAGPSAMATFLNEPVISADLASEKRWAAAEWCPMALAHGLRACFVTPISSRAGQVLGAVGIYYDIPRTPMALHEKLIDQFTDIASIAVERAQTHTVLKRSEARKAAILQSALDCVVAIDHEGRITEFNPAAERTFGYRRHDVVGRYLADVIIPPSLRAQHRLAVTRYLATGEAHVLGRHVEMTAMRADGSEFPVELAITRISMDGPPCFTGYLRDITERKQAEEELRRGKAFLAEGQRLSSTGTFSWRVATGEIAWSDELYRIFQFDRNTPITLELIGSRVHPDDLPLVQDMIDFARAAVSEFEFEHRLLMPDHSVKYVHMVAHGTTNQNGELEYIGAAQDVTQRRLSEEALGKVRSELAHVARITTFGALTASIAHEVNQPLSGIVTNASTCLRMLGADPPNVEGARETARRTIRDGNRASDVITRLRALFAKQDTATESVDLNEATREVVALSVSELHANRVIVRAELDDDLPPVIGDRVQLQQVILNLLRNASDAMSAVEDRPRQLVIKTERHNGDHVRLSVQDSGMGFEPQGADRLFEAFYTTKNGGMGIGLSVSRSIIENHHGRLWAARNDGPGATFAFSIPYDPRSATGAGHRGGMRTDAA